MSYNAAFPTRERKLESGEGPSSKKSFSVRNEESQYGERGSNPPEELTGEAAVSLDETSARSRLLSTGVRKTSIARWHIRHFTQNQARFSEVRGEVERAGISGKAVRDGLEGSTANGAELAGERQ